MFFYGSRVKRFQVLLSESYNRPSETPYTAGPVGVVMDEQCEAEETQNVFNLYTSPLLRATLLPLPRFHRTASLKFEVPSQVQCQSTL